ncbi:MAG: 3,4-dihydroxy-2-butanone-4-phosphate synthase, partial [Bacteroidia bacterium]|nr:3,4-dihydroxy-2-butanone-4-phosphate synthase [Bacteroidia bacterium]
MEHTLRLNRIEDALEDIRSGKVVIVVDDEDRENEGDFVAAARHVTPEVVNFMATHGRGLICASIEEKRAEELQLEMMVPRNTSQHSTPFTVSVDLTGNGCTTGISASDRSKTIRALIDPSVQPSDFARPGHIFPLRAKNGGVLRRAGHTEASVDLAKLAGCEPAGALVEIMNEDGTMARLPQLFQIAQRFNLSIISIKDLIAYRLKRESIVERKVEVDLPTEFGKFRLIAFTQTTNGMEHLALVKGSWEEDEPILVRVHSSCLTGD